jgi:hypothetical protein
MISSDSLAVRPLCLSLWLAFCYVDYMSCRQSAVPMNGPLMLSDGPVWLTGLSSARPLCYTLMPTMYSLWPIRWFGVLQNEHWLKYNQWMISEAIRWRGLMIQVWDCEITLLDALLVLFEMVGVRQYHWMVPNAFWWTGLVWSAGPPLS